MHITCVLMGSFAVFGARPTVIPDAPSFPPPLHRPVSYHAVSILGTVLLELSPSSLSSLVRASSTTRSSRGHLSSHFSRWAPHVARSSGGGRMSSYFSSSVPWLPLPALLELATQILLVPQYPGRTHQCTDHTHGEMHPRRVPLKRPPTAWRGADSPVQTVRSGKPRTRQGQHISPSKEQPCN